MDKIEKLLQIHFAILTAIGGLLMSSGEVGVELPLIAVVSSAASYALVDRARIISLSTPFAYLGMGGVAAYSMMNFLWTGTDNQLMAVAQLLVLVLVVLQFQRKSLKVFEQIGVFCLLELIVAAVFNSALTFGLLLIPFSLVGLRALVLLQALTTIEASNNRDDGIIKTGSPFSIDLIGRRPRRFPRYGIVVLTPSVLLIAALFFYGLPRIGGQAEAGRLGGNQTIGFAESLHLDQVGSLLNNPELVMRVGLTDLRNGARYRVQRPIYFRGQVLETYDFRSGSGNWSVFRLPTGDNPRFLPDPAYPEQRSAAVLFDEVQVEIDQQPLTSEALFSIPAYHNIKQQTNIEHITGRWILRRRPSAGDYFSNRIHYRFGTHAFINGIQNRYTRYFGAGEYGWKNPSAASGNDSTRNFPTINSQLIREMTYFSPTKMPSVVREVDGLKRKLGDAAKSPFRFASEVELYLATDPSFRYSTDLTNERNSSVDPIEEFLNQYRTGHCQYFASAMVMMLRSQNIPARVVVGYLSDEQNTISGQYIVRQSHAHAWVEALIAEDDLPVGANLVGQPSFGPVLVRFDPTPGRRELGELPGQRVRHFYDFAQTLWNSYILDMNSERQSEALFGREESSDLTNAYSRMMLQISGLISRIDTGHLGAGALSGGRLFSWRGAVLGIFGTLILFGLYQIGLPGWLKRKWTTKQSKQNEELGSRVDFYELLCQKLARIGLLKPPGKTPKEFLHQAETKLHHSVASDDSPLAQLLALYYRVRFSQRNVLSSDEQRLIEQALAHVDSLVDSQRQLLSPVRTPVDQ